MDSLDRRPVRRDMRGAARARGLREPRRRDRRAGGAGSQARVRSPRGRGSPGSTRAPVRCGGSGSRGVIFPFSHSPVGRLVAFQREGDLVTARRIGDPHARLVARRIHDAVWSPDGRRLAFMRGGEIRVTGPGLRGSRRVSSGAHATEERAAWSPGGQQIAFFRKVAPRGCATVGVGILRLTTGAARTVYRPGTGAGACENASDLAWAPARRLAVGTVDRLFVSGAGTVALHPLAVRPAKAAASPRYVTWLPGGRTLAYTLFDCLEPGPCGMTIRAVRGDGSGDRRVAFLPWRFGVSAVSWWP